MTYTKQFKILATCLLSTELTSCADLFPIRLFGLKVQNERGRSVSVNVIYSDATEFDISVASASKMLVDAKRDTRITAVRVIRGEDMQIEELKVPEPKLKMSGELPTLHILEKKSWFSQ